MDYRVVVSQSVDVVSRKCCRTHALNFQGWRSAPVPELQEFIYGRIRF